MFCRLQTVQADVVKLPFTVLLSFVHGAWLYLAMQPCRVTCPLQIDDLCIQDRHRLFIMKWLGQINPTHTCDASLSLEVVAVTLAVWLAADPHLEMMSDTGRNSNKWVYGNGSMMHVKWISTEVSVSTETASYSTQQGQVMERWMLVPFHSVAK